jgi:serine phosphatase RsbU (regulator of sigma subunit)
VAEGDRLLLYTDGISDALENGTQAADERIRAAVEEHPAGGPALLDALVWHVRQQLTADSVADDLTLVTAHVLSRAES